MTGSLRHAEGGSLGTRRPSTCGCQIRRRIGRRVSRRQTVRDLAAAGARRARRLPRSAGRARAPRSGLHRQGAREATRSEALPSRRRSSTSARLPASGTSMPTRRSGARASIRCARRGASTPSRRAGSPRIRHALELGIARQGTTLRDYALPTELGRDAGRVQGLRPRGRAVPPLRDADREDPCRRARHLVLPGCQPSPSEPARRGRPRLGPWPGGRTRPRRSCCGRSASRKPTGSSISTRVERGRIGAIAKGIRKTKSRFGARLEPLSHVELMLHEGSGELQTVTGASLIASHSPTRESR